MNSLMDGDQSVDARPSRRWIVWFGLAFLAWACLATAADEVLRHGFPLARRATSLNLPTFLVSAAAAAAVIGGGRLGRAVLPGGSSANALRQRLGWDPRSLLGGLAAAVVLMASLVGISVYNARQLQEGQLPLTARWQAEVAGKPITLAYITWQPNGSLRTERSDGLYLVVNEGRAVTVRQAEKPGTVFSVPRSIINTLELRADPT